METMLSGEPASSSASPALLLAYLAQSQVISVHRPISDSIIRLTVFFQLMDALQGSSTARRGRREPEIPVSFSRRR